ncbi:hypothetical protein LC612_30635 [Nostoc sp. CHAB 5834]|nr:hypothetical protein [Nostoc sp. CHAB 5834]
MNFIAIPAALMASGINSYTDEGDAKKSAFHKEGKKFLKALAKQLDLRDGTYDIRSNVAGMAVSGEVTLHGDHLYVQLSESCIGRRGVQMLYRSCEGRKDYCGGRNNFAFMADLNNGDTQARVVDYMRDLCHAHDDASIH